MVKIYMDTSIEVVFKIVGQYHSLQILWYRWDDKSLELVWTHIEALGHVFGRLCLFGVYACDMMITMIHIHMIHMRYRSLGSIWIHTDDLGCVLGRFCPLRTRLCMHIYDEIWDDIFMSICIALGCDGT